MYCYSEVAAEIGKLWICCSSKGIAVICRAKGSRMEFENACRKRFGCRPQFGEIPASYRNAVMKAVAGRAFTPVPVDLSDLPAFQQRVLKALQKVPRGKVQTYASLAGKAGRPGAARAVGNAMARNPVPFIIPCHRIVPSSGGVGNYGMGSALKRTLLAREGVAVDQL
jgi:O-6-methylguanine DNA methyltransferase